MTRGGEVITPNFSSWNRPPIDGANALNQHIVDDPPSAPRLSLVADVNESPVGLRVIHADRNVVSLTERRLLKERPSEQSELEAWNRYFDTYWEEEGLSQDWYNLKSQRSNKRVGFIMDRQLSSLNPFNRASVLDTATKAERDVSGFKLEFLSKNHNVYPRLYIKNEKYPDRLEDPLYGKSKIVEGVHADIIEIISDEERNGSVRKSMKKIKEFLLRAPKGAMAVMTSPLGDTGFETDDGLSIRYPDSYFFVLENRGNGEVMNYTIKTKFTLKECRSAITRLTGIKLHEGASVEEYVDAIALINPGESKKIKSVFDIVDVLKDIHPESAFVDDQNGKILSWEDVKNDIKEGEKLYNFDKRSSSVLNKLSKFMRKAVYRTREEFQKGIASAILLLGKDFIKREYEESLHAGIEMRPEEWVNPAVEPFVRFDWVLEETAARRGCSGGGEATSIMTVGGSRSAIRGGESNCPDCGKDAANNHYHCPSCNAYFKDETKVDSENRTKKCSCGHEFGC